MSDTITVSESAWEHANHLAKTAEFILEAMESRELDGDDYRALSSAVYEFRKRSAAP